MRAKYTITLNDLIEDGFNLFNFEWTIQPNTVSKDEVQDTIIRMYQFREIGLETPYYFQQEFKNSFLNNLPWLNKTLEIYYTLAFAGGQEKKTSTISRDTTTTLTRTDATKKTTEDTNTIDKSVETSNNVGDRYLDTPENVLGSTSTRYATSINNQTQSGSETTDETDTRNIDETGSLNRSDDGTEETTENEDYTITRTTNLTNELKNRYEVNDILYQFALKFDDLFMGVF